MGKLSQTLFNLLREYPEDELAAAIEDLHNHPGIIVQEMLLEDPDWHKFTSNIGYYDGSVTCDGDYDEFDDFCSELEYSLSSHGYSHRYEHTIGGYIWSYRGTDANWEVQLGYDEDAQAPSLIYYQA